MLRLPIRLLPNLPRWVSFSRRIISTPVDYKASCSLQSTSQPVEIVSDYEQLQVRDTRIRSVRGDEVVTLCIELRCEASNGLTQRQATDDSRRDVIHFHRRTPSPQRHDYRAL